MHICKRVLCSGLNEPVFVCVAVPLWKIRSLKCVPLSPHMSLAFSRDFWKCPSFLEIYCGNPTWEDVEWIHLAQDRVQMCASMMQNILTEI